MLVLLVDGGLTGLLDVNGLAEFLKLGKHLQFLKEKRIIEM